MESAARMEQAELLLEALAKLEKDWKEKEREGANANSASFVAMRERLKAIEAQTALIRLMQSESRLKQQILLGVGSFATGSLVTWLVQRFLGS